MSKAHKWDASEFIPRWEGWGLIALNEDIKTRDILKPLRKK
jgi:hypothetical protein